MHKFWLYSEGITFGSVCTSLTDAEATERINREHPTGVGADWGVSTLPSFADGTPNPGPCAGNPANRHILFVIGGGA